MEKTSFDEPGANEPRSLRPGELRAGARTMELRKEVMAKDVIRPTEGDFFEGVLLETFRDGVVSRPRVRPVELLPQSLKVEFPRNLRERNPMGTRFRADVHVRQKHYGNGFPKGDLYLRAENSTIRKIEEPDSEEVELARQQPGTISGRAYEYIRVRRELRPIQDKFDDLRILAYGGTITDVPASRIEALRRDRSKLIGEYALLRSAGTCEGCQNPAPFIRQNGKPYLEVHHLVPLGDGGDDGPRNVAAVCPNCHARVSHGKDGPEHNEKIRNYVQRLENSLDAGDV
jgi:HNH endonuclease